MKGRNWIILYLTVGIFFGLSTGAGLAMPTGEGFNIMKFMFILVGMILLIARKIGKIVKNL